MNFNLSSPKDQLIVIALAAAVVLVLAIFFLFRPQLGRLNSLPQEQKVELDKLEQAKVKLKRLDALRREAAAIEAERIDLSRRVPAELELPSLIVDLQRLADDAGLDLDSIEVDDGVEDLPGYQRIEMKIAARGTFYDIVDFMYRMEKLKREIVMGDFALEVTEYPELAINMDASVFTIEKTMEAETPSTPPQGAGEPGPTGAGPQGSPGPSSAGGPGGS